MKSKEKRLAPIPMETDLRAISRRSDRCRTAVLLHWDWEKQVPWLILGEARLCHQRDRHDGRWRLDAYLPVGVCDPEHDSAYVLRLPLIGVTFEGVNYHATTVSAWVDPNAVDDYGQDFHVPRPGYNPMQHPKARTCTAGGCKEPHIIVPEDHFVPPFDAELYKLVAGKKVEIRFSTIAGDSE